jgi:DNA-binding NarL/FixJ family response regulator
MKIEGNPAQTDVISQVRSPDKILLPSAGFPICAPSSMSARTQPLGISVSVIEHAPRTGRLFSDWIRGAGGFTLVSHHPGADSAFAALPSDKPSIVLIDLNLPGIGACNCVRRLKPILQHTQFVTINADEDSDRIFNALAAGATGYLLTRTPRADLLAALKLIHAGGSPMSHALAKKVLQSFQGRLSAAAAELSPREVRILRLLSQGSSYDEAAAILNITLPMVSTYIRSIYEKLQLQANASTPP